MSLARIGRLTALVFVLLVCLALLLKRRKEHDHSPPTELGTAGLISPEVLARFTAIEARERQIDEQAFSLERRAELCGKTFEDLWDQVNRSTNQLKVLDSFQIGQIALAGYDPPRAMAHEIELRNPAPPTVALDQSQWRELLAQKERDGWRLQHIEFVQRGFDPASGQHAERSRFSFRADLDNPRQQIAATLEGDLFVEWQTSSVTVQPTVRKVDASHVSIRSRKGSLPFQPLLSEAIAPLEKWLFIDPLIVYDLDGDGLPEIILAGKNLVYKLGPDGHYASSPLCRESPGRIFTALVADFDGDGIADFLCAKPEGLLLFKGASGGKFDEPGRLVWAASPALKYGQVLTCGDIDRDGDLDVFIGQYKSPYFHGQMPTPYYGANDSDPAYLLLNDGKGVFSDATETSGLGKKRWRRSYSGSFARLDGGNNLDLIVVSDFAGVDLYQNDGKGHFTDCTTTWLPESLGFGMAHALTDFNSDGRLDLLMIGMDSPTVDRLDHLELFRPDATEDHSLRTRLTAGNRLFLARPGGGFERNALGDSVADSGWSWGCAAADFDNNGFPDLYVANGHETRANVHDYEEEFWLHDIYVAGSTNDPAANLYFQSKFTRTRGNGQSYGGYQQNRLYLNLEAGSFLESGHLLGVALPEDSRNAVSADLDGDGRMDLLVTTFEVWPEPRQTLRVYRNTLADCGNWIGFVLHEQSGRSPVGASATIHYDGHTATRQIVTGDSYRCQSPNTLHFGLGSATQVDWVDIIWADGSKTRIQSPKVNSYHAITAAR